MWIDRSEMMERSKKTALKQNNCRGGGADGRQNIKRPKLLAVAY